MIATLRRSGFATEAIPPVYDGERQARSPSSSPASWRARRSSQTGQQFPRALAELLVVADLLGVHARLVLLRQAEIRNRDVVPGRGDAPAAVGDLLLASRDLLRLALLRQIRGANAIDVLRQLDLVALQAGGGTLQRVGRFGPMPQVRVHETEIEAGLAVLRVALERRGEARDRDVELLPAVGDESRELRHLRVDQRSLGRLDVFPCRIQTRELQLVV